MSLNEVGKKMGKSDSSDSYIGLDEQKDSVIKKFKRAITDSGSEIKYSMEKPALSNLLVIYSEFSGKPISELEKEYDGKGYGLFKNDLGELVAGKLSELQKTFSEIRNDEERLNGIINEGNSNAGTIASEKILIVKRILGLY